MGHLHKPARSAALCGFLVLLTAGCERAARYGPVKGTGPAAVAAPKPEEPLSPHYAWLQPSPVADIPIVFVDAVSNREAWQKLPHFWNHYPSPTDGSRLAPLGLSPLSAATTVYAIDQLEIIKIKVPLGLPDPTPDIPPSNPLTYAKWMLGKRLFFDRTLLAPKDGYACASCHRPEEGFTCRNTPPLRTYMIDTLNLLNCVYNKSQFWDGRVGALEQVIQRNLEDEQPPKETAEKEKLRYSHVWSGVLHRLNAKESYRKEFQRVFGYKHDWVTQDALGKALATYMRTILSGNSLYDRAVQAAGQLDNGKLLTAKQFEPLLHDDILARLDRAKKSKAEVARELQDGYQVFHRGGGCAGCHKGWNFTDNSFHNIGIRESDSVQKAGEEHGHFRQQPIGLKDTRMIGAFRTPTLRNLPRTAPYFHDPYARYSTLEAVVEYFSTGIDARLNAYLDPELLAGPGVAKRLDLHPDDVRALVLFLKALDGDPVPAIIAAPPRE